MPSTYNASRAVISPLSVLGRKHHVAIVGVHHMYRTGSARRPIWERVQGSIGGFASADACFALIRNQDTGQLVLHMTGKDVLETSFVIQEENGILRADLQTTVDAEVRTDDRAEVIRAIQANPGSDARIIAAFVERPVNNVRQQLHHMAHDGEIRRENGLFWTLAQWKALAEDANPQQSITRLIDQIDKIDPLLEWFQSDRTARGIDRRRAAREPG
jgi:hypothetical protein